MDQARLSVADAEGSKDARLDILAEVAGLVVEPCLLSWQADLCACAQAEWDVSEHVAGFELPDDLVIPEAEARALFDARFPDDPAAICRPRRLAVRLASRSSDGDSPRSSWRAVWRRSDGFWAETAVEPFGP